ncbi:hypothetical protein NDU88_003384 [Pleurodeles waltl]|uniref:Uncharacterized protein n=1 Tax=Pleurodeles waltl TaxID=8319 RepID=A0AAV7MQE1_PLEWA|nr:hypothetical protein NDU88_003384 [Pleurodeles waltl]
MLSDLDILEDWTAIKKVGESVKKHSCCPLKPCRRASSGCESIYQAKAAAVSPQKRKSDAGLKTDKQQFSARCEDGQLHYEGESFCKGQNIVLEIKDEAPSHAIITAVSTGEVWLRRRDGSKTKIYVSQLQKGPAALLLDAAMPWSALTVAPLGPGRRSECCRHAVKTTCEAKKAAGSSYRPTMDAISRWCGPGSKRRTPGTAAAGSTPPGVLGRLDSSCSWDFIAGAGGSGLLRPTVACVPGRALPMRETPEQGPESTHLLRIAFCLSLHIEGSQQQLGTSA